MACPNTNSPQWQALVEKIGVREAYREFMKHGDIPSADNYQETFKGVNATLKVIGALSTDKMEQVYKKFYANNKDKFYAELQNNGATKAQVQLLKEWNEANNPQSLPEMQAGIAAEMSYTVEINVAMEKRTTRASDFMSLEEIEESGMVVDSEEDWNSPSANYEWLNVPGGTNYRENEIKTPDITPSIKGHAQFATDNGIGWFRSDDKVIGGALVENQRGDYEQLGQMLDDGQITLEEFDRRINNITEGGTPTKIRRILEVQSDLFQKGREEDNLTRSRRKGPFAPSADVYSPGDILIAPNGEKMTVVHHEPGYAPSFSEDENVHEPGQPEMLTVRDSEGKLSDYFSEDIDKSFIRKSVSTHNSFLQLLNKENNWVTFFTKAIIQDSTRKGYEEVLFPAGDTASKIEGHESLVDYLANTQRDIDRLKGMLEPSSIEEAYSTRVKDAKDFLLHETTTPLEIKSLSSTDQNINPKIVNSSFEYVRVRQNYFDGGLRNSTGATLTGDDYDGWVLYEYTVGRRNKVTKITPDEAIGLLDKDNKLREKRKKDEVKELEDKVNQLLNGKEEFVSNTKRNVEGELVHRQKEYDDALSGRTQLSSINKFYEKDVQNILNKQGYAPERITDEYGNDWFKVKLKDDYKKTIYFNRTDETPKSFSTRAIEYLQSEGLVNTRQQQFGDKKYWVIRRTLPGSYNIDTNKLVYVLSHNYTRIQQINESYYQKNGFRPFTVIKLTDNTYAVQVNNQGAVFNRNLQEVEDSREAVDKLLNKLKDNTGLPYKIITADEAENITEGAKIPWNGEKAFFYQGTVYITEEGLSLNNALHEYSHPFVASLRLHNPEVYARLYSEMMGSNSAETQGIFDEVQKAYPEFGTASDEFKDEVFVRMLTAIAENRVVFDKNPQLKSFWSKLWFNIKQFFRKVFGQDINLDKLNEKTTLQDLAQMLTGEKRIPMAREFSDYVLFNRGLATEMTQIADNQVVKRIELFSSVLQDHLQKLNHNQNYKELREVLKNQYDGSLLSDANKLIKYSKELGQNIDENFKKLRMFGEAIIGVRNVSEKMKRHVTEMVTDDKISEKDKLRTLMYYSYMVKDWTAAFDDLRKMNADDLPLLNTEIQQTLSNFKRVQDGTKEVFKGGLLEVMREQLSHVKERADAELLPQIKKLQAAFDGGNKTIEGTLNKYKELYKRANLDDDTIMKYLTGEMGDTNFFSAMLESYTSSPDPIVGGFASYLNKELYKVEGFMQDFSTNMRKELAPIYHRLGVNRSNPDQLGKELTYIETVYSKDSNGEPQGVQVHSFLNEFSGGAVYDYKQLEHKLEQARDEGDDAKTREARNKFEDFKKDYFHREYTDEIYNAKEFWKRDTITEKAYQKRKEITDELRSFESFNEVTPEDTERIGQLQRELRTLGSLKNLDGTDKTGDDALIAQAIKEYQELTRQFYEEKEMKGAFERDMQTFRDDLFDKGLLEDSPEFVKQFNGWLKENLTVRLTDTFYDGRQRIIDEIAAITSSLNDDLAKQLDISGAWKDIIEQVKGFRDKDGQPVGSEMDGDKIAEVRRQQERIDRIRDTLKKLNGLTNEEESRFSELWGILKAGIPLNETQLQEFNDIANKKKVGGLPDVDKVRLMALFEELKEFQSKIPTEYYMETLNGKLNEAGVQISIEYSEIEDFLNANVVGPMLETSNPFSEWFSKNHIYKIRWNPDIHANVAGYERLYVWNRIVPNDQVFKSALATNDYKTLMELDNPNVQVRPAHKYFFYRIKNEYRTKRDVGTTVDNRGNWLPKTLEAGAKDGKYRNQRYYDLKNSAGQRDKDLFTALQTYKKYHLKVQEDAPKYGRLWMEVPRMRKEKLENINSIISNPAGTVKTMLSYVGASLSFRPKADALDSGQLTAKDIKDENKLYVMTDLFGNEIQSIPMKYMSKLDHNDVSLDLFRSVSKYAFGLQVNKMLHDINPIAQALKSTVADEGIKNLNKTSRRNWLNTNFNVPVLSSENTRLTAISNMIQRDIEGVENKMEIGVFGNKVAKHIMGLAAFGSLALNIPAGVKNVVSAKIQNSLEAATGEHFSGRNLLEADGVFFSRFMPRLIADYNKFSGKSMETQMFELFDPVQGKFEEHFGEEGSASLKKDIGNLRFIRSSQAFGEIQAQGQAFIAMMKRTLVPQTINGVTSHIPYLDAWELRDGVIRLKEGINETWGKTGEKFAAFKLRAHKVNELLQGAYARMNQPEATRYTLFKLLNFMRRFLTPGIVNRFANNRVNTALGGTREGYYRAFLRVLTGTVKGGMKNWHLYTEKEKKQFWKTMAEMGYSMGFLALMTLLGYNSDDPDRNKKLKENSWIHNMTLYEIMMIKGEAETFIPLPGMGINEILRLKDQPSIAFPIMNKYYKIVSHLLDLVQQPFTDYDLIHYKRKTGIWEPGDLKLLGDLARLVGYTGATLDPALGIKNYSMTTNRYN